MKKYSDEEIEELAKNLAETIIGRLMMKHVTHETSKYYKSEICVIISHQLKSLLNQ